MKKIMFLLLFLLLLASVQATTYDYWREEGNETTVYINTSSFNGSQLFTISTTGGYSPRGDLVFPCFDNGSDINTWTEITSSNPNSATSNGTHILIPVDAEHIGQNCEHNAYNEWTTRFSIDGSSNSAYFGTLDTTVENGNVQGTATLGYRSMANWNYLDGIWFNLGVSVTKDQQYRYRLIQQNESPYYFWFYMNGVNYGGKLPNSPPVSGVTNNSNVAHRYYTDGTAVTMDIDWLFARRNLSDRPSVSTSYASGVWTVNITNSVNQSLDGFPIEVTGINLTGNLKVESVALNTPSILQNSYNHSTAINTSQEIVWRTNISTPSSTYDSTPTIRFLTDEISACRIGVTDVNYSEMSVNCATSNSTNHVCSLAVADKLTSDYSCVYLSCALVSDTSYQTYSSTSGCLNTSFIIPYPSSVTIYEPCSQNITLNSTGVSVYFNWSNSSSPANNSFDFDVYINNLAQNYLLASSVTNTSINLSLNNTLNTATYNTTIQTCDSEGWCTNSTSSCSSYFCVNDWTQVLGSCVNGTQSVTYIDSNNCNAVYNVPANNGTTQACSEATSTTSSSDEIKYAFWVFIILIAFFVAMAFRFQFLFFVSGLLTGLFAFFLKDVIAFDLLFIVLLFIGSIQIILGGIFIFFEE